MKFQLPWIGNANGSTGDMVFQSYNGRTYGHVKTNNYHYPDTEAQQKAQGLFYNIIHQYNAIYPTLKVAIPKAQRVNTNAYDVIASGLFWASLTYPNPRRKFPPCDFGLDFTPQVILSLSQVEISVTDKVIKAACTVQISTFRRFFMPEKFQVFLINVTQQMLIFSFDEYYPNTVAVDFENINKWQSTDHIEAYLSLYSPNFMSNYTRLPQ